MATFEGIYSEEERNRMIKKEFNRLKKSLKDLDEKKQITLNKLYQEAAFISATLEETRLIIIRDGVIEEYQNGANQHGVKKSAAVEVYDKMLNTYVKVIEQINKALPDPSLLDPAEEILRFSLGGRKK